MSMIITDADIVTLDPENPSPEALVTVDDRITFVGDLSQAWQHAGKEAQVRRLDGKTVIPGFNDNHIHTVFFGWTRSLPDLQGQNAEEIVETLIKAYPNPKKGELIRGGQWDYPSCPQPHRRILDEAFPGNPVYLNQYGGHAAWLNTAALKRYGITAKTKDPEGGEILKDPDGEPTGVVRELNSLKANLEMLPKFLGSKWAYDNIAISLLLLRKAGITSVQDNTWFPPHIRAIRRLYKQGELTARFSCWLYGEFPLFGHWMNHKRFRPPHYKKGPWKYFLDGTFTTRTAWLSDEYNDEPGNFGKGRDEAKIYRILEKLAKKDRQGAFHAIGDRMISSFLDTLERVYEKYPAARELRFRLEHAQLIKDRDIPRLRDLNVMVCAQPHAMATPEKDEVLLGKDRANQAYPFRRLLDAGVTVSFGSDFPGEASFEPLLGIDLAVNRSPKIAISPEEALSCYTKGSAYAEFAEEEKGILKSGYLADLAVLNDNPLKVDTRAIRDIEVIETILGGRSVYSRF